MTLRVLKSWLLALLVAVCAGCSDIDSPALERDDSAFQLPIPIKGSLQNPAWSPDGKSILFTRFRNGYNQGPADLVTYDLESGNIRVLVSDENDNVNLPGSAWNGPTNRIVFSSSKEPHDEIYMISAFANPGEEIKVTDRERLVAYEPSFSPDGRWVVFESHQLDVEDNGVITMYRIDGTETYQTLTELHSDCRQPNWSPDGSLILYQTMIGGRWEIWVMKPDGTGKRQISSGAGDKTDASFSPDGEWIVYSGESSAVDFANLFIVSISGGDPIQLTRFEGYDGAPSWSPDERHIIFESGAGDGEGSRGTTIWIITIEFGQ